MRTQFEDEDIKIIVSKVIEAIKPLIAGDRKHGTEEDIIFDIKGLSSYLNVSIKWLYEQTCFKRIPHLKLSNKQLRFRKKDIDKWLDSLKRPAVSEPASKLRLLK